MNMSMMVAIMRAITLGKVLAKKNGCAFVLESFFMQVMTAIVVRDGRRDFIG